jgi:hypothetical protein
MKEEDGALKQKKMESWLVDFDVTCWVVRDNWKLTLTERKALLGESDDAWKGAYVFHASLDKISFLGKSVKWRVLRHLTCIFISQGT